MQKVSASVQPHDHDYAQGGPVNVILSPTNQARTLATWGRTRPLIHIEQPEDDTNLTYLNILFLRPGTKSPVKSGEARWHRARQWRQKEGSLRIRLRNRLMNTLKHPMPTGRWVGTLTEDPGEWVLYFFQAVTLRTHEEEPPKSMIIQPGDEDFVVPPRHS